MKRGGLGGNSKMKLGGLGGFDCNLTPRELQEGQTIKRHIKPRPPGGSEDLKSRSLKGLPLKYALVARVSN